MSVFGIIFCAYNTADLLLISLPPWIAARRASLGGHQFKICAVCCPFEGFNHEDPVDNTLEVLRTHFVRGEIDHIVVSSVPVSEVKARGEALKWLVGEGGVDYLWQVDNDEQFTEQDIFNVAQYVQDHRHVPWFRVSYRNLVFDTSHYLAEHFTPARIHRVDAGQGLRATGFWDDNNVLYPPYRDVQLASITIPARVAAPLHYSWLNNNRSRLKIQYQIEGRKWPSCSFRWDEKLGLCFNEAHFAARGEPLPEVFSLDTSP